MNRTPAHDAPIRRAALALHGMGDADRDWMLASVAPAHRRLLEPLLAELHALGIARDPRLLDPIEESTPAAPAALPSTGISEEEAQRLAVLCSREPAPLVAQLLVACPHWRDQVLASMSTAVRAAVEDVGSTIPAAPALGDFLRTAVRQELAIVSSRAQRPWWVRRLWMRRDVA